MASGKQTLAINPESHVLDLALVSGQGEGVISAFDVPKVDVTIAAPGGEGASVGLKVTAPTSTGEVKFLVKKMSS